MTAALARHSHEPVALTRGNRSPPRDAVAAVSGDVRDLDTMRDAVAGVDGVCHLAARTRVRDSLTNPAAVLAHQPGRHAQPARRSHGQCRSTWAAGAGSRVHGQRLRDPSRQPITEDAPTLPQNYPLWGEQAGRRPCRCQCGSDWGPGRGQSAGVQHRGRCGRCHRRKCCSNSTGGAVTAGRATRYQPGPESGNLATHAGGPVALFNHAVAWLRRSRQAQEFGPGRLDPGSGPGCHSGRQQSRSGRDQVPASGSHAAPSWAR